MFVAVAALLCVALVGAASLDTSGFRKTHTNTLHPEHHKNKAAKGQHNTNNNAHHKQATKPAHTAPKPHSHSSKAHAMPAAVKHAAPASIKHHSAKTNHHSTHKVLADLEKEEAENMKVDVEERVVADLKKEVKAAMGELEQLQTSFDHVRKELNVMEGDLSKVPMPAPLASESSNLVQSDVDTAPATHASNDKAEKNEDNKAAADEDDDEDTAKVSLLQMPQDEMNEGLADDDTSAPRMMPKAMRRHMLLQNTLQKPDDDEGVTFGMRGDGSGNTFDVTDNGDVVRRPLPSVPEDMVKPNDVQYRVNPADPELAGVDVAPTDPAMTVQNSNVPGTNGKQLSLSSTSNKPAQNEDVMCVCKRQGAPRGEDRIRCKKHPTPTPTPAPTPELIVGTIQCVNGTWQEGAGDDSGVRDTICISFPARIEQPPPPEQHQEEEEREYPAECYDERNEFVVDAIKQKRDAEGGLMVLLQNDAGHCECEG